MSWLDDALDRLARAPVCGYRRGGRAAVEPTALAAMALTSYGRNDSARRALAWLVEIQSSDGSLGINAIQPAPKWATGWAVLAWRVARAAAGSGPSPWDAAAARGARWLLAAAGKAEKPSPDFGHDVTLIGWPWVEGTHSWIEPTAISLLALKAAGYGRHARSREAVRLVVDRRLPSGGWNYGNTTVLGNTTHPDVQSTGLALAALAGEGIEPGTFQPSLDWLRKTLSASTPTASLGYAVLGMAGHRAAPAEAPAWLEAACSRTLRRDAEAYRLAIAALAAMGDRCPWFVRFSD